MAFFNAEYYMEEIIKEASHIVSENERFSRNASNYGYTLAEQYLRSIGPEGSPMSRTGRGDTGRVISKQLTDPPVVDQPPPPPDYDLAGLFNPDLLGDIPYYYGLIKDERDAYIQEFFPDCLTKLSVMCDWLHDVIENGYTGLPAHIEDAIWNRDRTRVDITYRNGADEFFADHASRGFPMPSGPLAAQLDKLNDGRTNAVAVASREAAIKQYETAIETVKFAVKTSSDLYLGLHKIVDDVMKNAIAMYLGAFDNTTKMAQAIAALYGMNIAYYDALESWHKLQLSNEVPQGTLDLKADEINTRIDIAVMERHLQVAMEKAQNMANLVTSALNAQQTITTVNDNTERAG